MIEVVGGVEPPVAPPVADSVMEAAPAVADATVLEEDDADHDPLYKALCAYVPLRDAARAAERENAVSQWRWQRANGENAEAEKAWKEDKNDVTEACKRECESRLAECLERKDRADDA
eukprot:2230748-Prymnesium_polylepis.1